MDALFYTPGYMFHDRLHVNTVVLMLKRLGDEDHLLSIFTYSMFSIFHIPELKQEAFDNLLNIVKRPGMSHDINKFIHFLVRFMRSWEEIEFRFDMLDELCSELYQNDNKVHFNAHSWPVFVRQLNTIDCYKCRVRVVLYNFCNPQYYF